MMELRLKTRVDGTVYVIVALFVDAAESHVALQQFASRRAHRV
jgi:hypothetical protein